MVCKDNDGDTACHIACFKGYDQIVKILLEKRADVINNNDTPLHVACQFGHEVIMNMLLQAGADPSVENNMKNTSLHLAHHSGRQDVFRMLILCNIASQLS